MSSFVGSGLEAVGLVSPPEPVSLTTESGESIEFEATIRETHFGSSTPTDHPVEDGSTISDHVINQPDELELESIISNRPILALASVRKSPSIEGGDPNTRVEDAYAALVRWRKTAELITASTRLRDYESMIILSESVPRDKDTGEILSITLRLREMNIATVEAVAAPDPVEPVNAPKKNLGRKQTSPASAEVEGKSQSLFAQIAGVFG